MELLLALLALVVVAVAAWFWGVDSRDGFYDPLSRQPDLKVR